jgi:4-hydroxybenzoyl-CoA thioesterase
VATTEFSHELRVYIEDTDAGGIVYYVNYLKFMERARTEFMRSLGYGTDYIFSSDLMFVVRDVAVTYILPARLDDELDVTASVVQVRGAALIFRQSVRRRGELLAQGEVTVACVDRSSVKPRRFPTEIATQLRAMEQKETQI